MHHDIQIKHSINLETSLFLSIIDTYSSLSFTSNSSRSFSSHCFRCFSRRFSYFLGSLSLNWSRFLGCLFSSCLLLGCSNGLFSLGFPNFGFHVPLGKDFGQRCSYNCSLETDGLSGLLLRLSVCFETLLVMPSIQNRP